MIRLIKQLSMLLLLVPLMLTAQEEFANTMSLKAGETSPKADLSAIEWVAGAWRGEAFGGITEEVWTPPLGGSMMCVFKLVVNEQVRFYEIVTISEENETLILRLKHFNADLTGWEEKNVTVDFKLVKVSDNKVFFDGFTFEKISEDEINIYVVVDNQGKRSEVKFNYHRVK